MTEEEWASGHDVDRMLKHLGKVANPRRLRLFLVACARRVLPNSPDDEMLSALDTAEKFADQSVSKRELARVRNALKVGHPSRVARWEVLYTDSIRSVPAWHAAREQVTQAAVHGSGCCAWSTTRERLSAFEKVVLVGYPTVELTAQAGLLRDIFGNPFRPFAFNPCWRTADVLGLARAIYEDRAFERLPILADALMDAGCADEQILSHCRGDGPHVRGCWVVDLVLGKE
jgi:hypothetical protein